MIMSVRAKPALVEQALRAGAHQVLVLPTTASTLYRRFDWLINDDRPFELSGKHYVGRGWKKDCRSAFTGPSMSRGQSNLSPPAAILPRRRGSRRARGRPRQGGTFGP
jgi:hypothetical protein